MTPADFINQFGAEWKAFENTAMGASLLRLLEDQHPVRRLPTGPDMANLRLAGAPVFLNEIAGYELAIEIVRSLGREPKKKPDNDEDTFTDPEIH